jgi:hypothetical protein
LPAVLAEGAGVAAVIDAGSGDAGAGETVDDGGGGGGVEGAELGGALAGETAGRWRRAAP